ncbi:TPA: hypothetical protein ACGIK9_003297 [Acinetobacter baumannii]|uniref:hypothetical protein n=1 Tax=Acinetobacter baumannii TaxID=470 RepID=UPI00338F27EA
MQTIQNFSLIDLNLNTVLLDSSNKFHVLAELIDHLHSPAPNSMDEYLKLIPDVLEQFPKMKADDLYTFANSWKSLLGHFIKARLSMNFEGFDTKPEFNKLVDNASKLDHGLLILELSQESFVVPSFAYQQLVHCNNLELSLAVNYLGLSVLIEVLSEFQYSSSKSLFGLDRQKHKELFVLLEDFTRYQYDRVYNLMYGCDDEQREEYEDENNKHPASIQRSKCINTQNIFYLVD